MSQPKVVLDEDDIRRTLVRIAHEIVEKNPDGQVALVGIHRRGAHLATRLHRLVSDLLETELAAGEIDIAFYRDDLATREAPEVRSSHLPFRLEDHTIVLVDDVLYTGRTVRAAIEALFDYGRPARVQLAVLADRGHRELPIRPDYVGKNLPDPPLRARQRARRRARRRRRGHHHDAARRPTHEAPALDRGPRPRRHRAHPRPREVLHRGLRARGQEGARAARPARAQPLLRGLDAHALELRARRQDAQRRGHQLRLVAARASRRASRSRTRCRRSRAYRPDLIVVRTPHVGAAELVARWSPAAVVNAGDGKHEHPTQALLDVYTLRERLGALDGANIWIVGDVLHSRVARSNIQAFTMLGARVTVCGPPTLIPRGMEALGCEVAYTLDRLAEADVVYALRMQKERMTESFVPEPARVRRALPDRRPPARRPPGAHAPGPGQPRRRARRRGDRLAAGGDRPAGRGRRRRADGGALRAARRAHRARPRADW